MNYKILFEHVTEIVKKISTNSDWELRLALEAIIWAIRELPDSEDVLKNIRDLDMAISFYIFNKSSEMIWSDLIARAEHIYDLAYQEIVTSTIPKIMPIK